jgi:hypothetical protein
MRGKAFSVYSSICNEVLDGLLDLVLEEGEVLILPQRKYVNPPSRIRMG